MAPAWPAGAAEFSGAMDAEAGGGVDGAASAIGGVVKVGAGSAAVAEGLAAGALGVVAGAGLVCWTAGGEAVAAGDVSCANSAPPLSNVSATVAVASLDLFENIA